MKVQPRKWPIFLLWFLIIFGWWGAGIPVGLIRQIKFDAEPEATAWPELAAFWMLVIGALLALLLSWFAVSLTGGAAENRTFRAILMVLVFCSIAAGIICGLNAPGVYHPAPL